MNRREMNVFGMLQTLLEFLKANLSSFQDKEAIMNVISELENRIESIKSLNELQSVSTEAEFAVRDETEAMLINNAVKVADGLKVIAATKKDTRLKTEAKISRWDLGRMRETDKFVRLKQLNATALLYTEELLELGITKAEIDSLDIHTDELMKSTPIIENVKLKTAQATTELGQNILEASALVRETLDPLMLRFKILDSTLYGEYLNARKINNRSAGRSPRATT